MLKRLSATILAGFLLAACHGGGPVASGIRGLAVRGASGGKVGIPLPEPSPCACPVTILDASNRTTVARVTAPANGIFEVALPPGRYIVEGWVLSNTITIVHPHRYTAVRVEFLTTFP